MKIRLILMNFLEFAVWGAYLTSLGRYLGEVGLREYIGWFFSVQGMVSIVMPALMGIIADNKIQAQKLLGICHFLSAAGMLSVAYIAYGQGENVEFSSIFPIYTFAMAFYMPTLALSYSVSYNALTISGLDTVKAFPPIRIFGTIGFIVAMLTTDFAGLQDNCGQFILSGAIGLCLAIYSFTLPKCEIKKSETKKNFSEALGLNAFKLFKRKKIALFFIFSMFLGVNLQITNGYANNFITSFSLIEEYKNAFFCEHTNLLISLSQFSETFCILLIPYFMSKFGIKRVMLIAMFAWVLRFGFFAIGNPVMPGVIWFILSMIVYGVAFDFFNVSGSLFVDKECDSCIRSSAQGLFFLMTNGLGASIGMIAAQAVVNAFSENNICQWPTVWTIFTCYAFLIAVLFGLIFKDDKNAKAKTN